MAIPQRLTPRRKSYIIRHPKVLGGEPSVRGTRISVRSIVLAAREYGGVPGVLTAYPHLRPAAIEEALAYYEQHRAEIDEYIRENLSAG
jgi:uncharacterized protein (DUF433 family)